MIDQPVDAALVQAVWLPLLAAGAALLGIAYMIGQLRRARLIEDTPTSKIRSAAQGYVELSGFARPDGNSILTAPLTGRPCLWYRYTIERVEQNRLERRWRPVESHTSEQAFRLDDATGDCLVDPRQAELTVQRCQRWTGNRRHPLKPDQGLLSRLIRGQYRYTEYRIESGDWLYVMGWFATPRCPGFEEQRQALQKQLLNQWKQDQPTLARRFDHNRDGRIDSSEWEQARTAAGREAAHRVTAMAMPEPAATLSRGDGRHPYLIATEDPRQLAGHYRWRAFGALLAGGGCAFFLLAKAMIH